MPGNPGVHTLDELVAAFPPVGCAFSAHGRKVQGQRLRPEETRRQAGILEAAYPPELPWEMLADGTPAPPRYDLRNPAPADRVGDWFF